MGRIILIILLASFSILTYSQRVQNSKWSATLEVGANQFDGDMTPSFTKTSFGLSGEYTISPTWGLGVEYYYLPLQAGKTAESMTSTMHHINPYISLNMLNLLSPDINTKWGIWATVGGRLRFISYQTLQKQPVCKRN